MLIDVGFTCRWKSRSSFILIIFLCDVKVLPALRGVYVLTYSGFIKVLYIVEVIILCTLSAFCTEIFGAVSHSGIFVIEGLEK